MTVGRGSYLDEVVRAAGAENVFGDLAASSATVSLEAIAARDPDVIPIMATDTATVPDLAARPGWRVLGVTESPIPGPEGNKEFLIAAERRP